MEPIEREIQEGEPDPKLIIELAVDEGDAMIAAFCHERGIDELEDNGLVDLTASLLHARQAATHQRTEELIGEVLSAIDSFREWTVGPRSVEDRLGLTLRCRLNSVESAALAGKDALARKELLELLRFFPPTRSRDEHPS